MRFSTSETLRSVVLDLKLASLLLGGLIFEDFRDCTSTLLCCEILTEQSQEIIRMIFDRLEIFYVLLLKCFMESVFYLYLFCWMKQSIWILVFDFAMDANIFEQCISFGEVFKSGEMTPFI